MTMDRTLKDHGRIVGNRSVLTRTERIAIMIEDGRFDPEKDSPLGIAKTRVRHSRAGSKSKKEETNEEVAEGEGDQESTESEKKE